MCNINSEPHGRIRWRGGFLLSEGVAGTVRAESMNRLGIDLDVQGVALQRQDRPELVVDPAQAEGGGQRIAAEVLVVRAQTAHHDDPRERRSPVIRVGLEVGSRRSAFPDQPSGFFQSQLLDHGHRYTAKGHGNLL